MPHSYEDINFVSPLFNALYESKKVLQFRYNHDNLDCIIARAVRDGNLRDVKACIKYGISPHAFKKAFSNSVSDKRPSIFFFLLNNFPHELAHTKYNLVEVLLGDAVFYNNTRMVSIILNDFPHELMFKKSDILKDLLFNYVRTVEMANIIQQLGAEELKFNTDELTEYLFKKVQRGDAGMVEWLCQQGADVNAIKPAPGLLSGDSTYTPLMWAVYVRHQSIAKILCTYGADIEQRTLLQQNNWSEIIGSAVDLARKQSDKTILNLLLSQLEFQKTSVHNVHCFFEQIKTDISTPAQDLSVPSITKGVEALIHSYSGFGMMRHS